MTRETGPRRSAFAHDAVLAMESDADPRAPGAAITVALCGHWDHEPPCPLAPHHTSAERIGAEVHLRTLFAVEPGREAEVRQRIDAALAAGALPGPDGRVTRWRLRDSRASTLRGAEADEARRLAHASS